MSDFDLAVSAFCLFIFLPDKDKVPMFARRAYMCKHSTMNYFSARFVFHCAGI